MKEKEKSNQQIYRVRVYKDFDFPSFSINKSNRLADVSYMAMEEIRNNSQDQSYFNFEIINVLPFTLRTQIVETTNNSDYDFFIREVALQKITSLYGEIDYEKNPDIFIKTSDTGTSVSFNLRLDIEDIYLKEVRNLTNMINIKGIKF